MEKMNRQDLLIVMSFSLIQIAFFGGVSWGKHDWINPDAVSYIRIAQYYLSGQTDFMISGYWGPLLSWIIAPLLPFVEEPLIAAHIAMGISSLVFLLGSFAVFRAMGIGTSALLVGLGIVVLSSVSWSTKYITPDVLVSGMLCLAISRTLVPDWCEKSSVQISAGVLFGLAYLAKAVALPLAGILVVAVGMLWIVFHQISPGRVVRSIAVTFLALGIIAGPWILLLSFKYEKPVFSTSAEINHTIIGPSNVNKGHPTFRTFHIPEQGRVTSWEDPRPAAYTSWSPLENTESMKHQLWVVRKNAFSSLNILKSFDWLGVGLTAVIFGFFFHVPWTKNMQVHRWRWSAIFIACLVGIYLPVAGSNMRYFLGTYPFLLAGSLGFLTYLVRGQSNQTKILHVLALTLVAVSFLRPMARIPYPEPNPNYQAATILKEKLLDMKISGPIASTSQSEYIAYFTAFLMETPFHGKSTQAQTVEEARTSSAKILIVERGTEMDLQLKKDENFISLDEQLFDALSNNLKADVKVYIDTKA